MDDPWLWYFKCKKCAQGTRYRPDMVRKADLLPLQMVVCQGCGGTQFEDPCSGRQESTNVWYNPYTWGTTKWVYREDERRELPHQDVPKPPEAPVEPTPEG